MMLARRRVDGLSLHVRRRHRAHHADPQVAIASDSSVLKLGEGVPHPRGYGNNVRVLGEYVRERKVITLEEAMRKMTSLPADSFGLPAVAASRRDFADIVVFDPATVGEAATFEKPHAYARGVPFVLVNGVPVVVKGEQTSARPGTADGQPPVASADSAIHTARWERS